MQFVDSSFTRRIVDIESCAVSKEQHLGIVKEGLMTSYRVKVGRHWLWYTLLVTFIVIT